MLRSRRAVEKVRQLHSCPSAGKRFSGITVSFLITFACLVLLLPAPSRAERLVGVIMTGDIPYYGLIHDDFVANIEKQSSQQVRIIVQKPNPDQISLRNAARKLMVADVDLIVVYGAPALLEAVQEKVRVPIVYSGVYEPVVREVRAKNVTGISYRIPLSSLVRYLNSISDLKDLAVIYSRSERDSVYQMEEIEKLSAQYGFKARHISIDGVSDVNRMLERGKYDAVMFTGSAAAHMSADAVLSWARAEKIPSATMLAGLEEVGAIITLSAKPHIQGELAAKLASRILKGDAPADIDPEVVKGTELIFNLKEATALQLKISMDLVTESTRIVK